MSGWTKNLRDERSEISTDQTDFADTTLPTETQLGTDTQYGYTTQPTDTQYGYTTQPTDTQYGYTGQPTETQYGYTTQATETQYGYTTQQTDMQYGYTGQPTETQYGYMTQQTDTRYGYRPQETTLYTGDVNDEVALESKQDEVFPTAKGVNTLDLSVSEEYRRWRERDKTSVFRRRSTAEQLKSPNESEPNPFRLHSSSAYDPDTGFYFTREPSAVLNHFAASAHRQKSKKSSTGKSSSRSTILPAHGPRFGAPLSFPTPSKIKVKSYPDHSKRKLWYTLFLFLIIAMGAGVYFGYTQSSSSGKKEKSGEVESGNFAPAIWLRFDAPVSPSTITAALGTYIDFNTSRDTPTTLTNDVLFTLESNSASTLDSITSSLESASGQQELQTLGTILYLIRDSATGFWKMTCFASKAQSISLCGRSNIKTTQLTHQSSDRMCRLGRGGAPACDKCLDDFFATTNGNCEFKGIQETGNTPTTALNGLNYCGTQSKSIVLMIQVQFISTTESMLQELQLSGLPATLLLSPAQQGPDFPDQTSCELLKLYQSSFELQHGGWSHLELGATTPLSQVASQIEQTRQWVARCLGTTLRAGSLTYFSPPNGLISRSEQVDYVKQQSVRLVSWSNDVGDGEAGLTSASIAQRVDDVLESATPEQSHIFLFRDTAFQAGQYSRMETIFKARGYTVVPLSECHRICSPELGRCISPTANQLLAF